MTKKRILVCSQKIKCAATVRIELLPPFHARMQENSLVLTVKLATF